jgi:hypothetical protein
MATRGRRSSGRGTSHNHDEQQQTVFVSNTEFVFGVTTQESGEKDYSTKIFVGNVDTGGTKTAVVTSDDFGIASMTLSGDRTRVLYSTVHSVAVMNVGEWKSSVIDQKLDFKPVAAWSPNGKYVIVGTHNPSTDSYSTTSAVQILLYDVASGTKWQVATVPGEGVVGITWGP